MTADNYLMLDGKKYELSPELVNALRPAVAEPEKKSPFERKVGEDFYCIDSNGFVGTTRDSSFVGDTEKYAVANYCHDRGMMEQRALHETLNRLLWRYSETHGGDSNPWPRGMHWFIYGDTANGLEMKVSANDSHKKQGTIYFKDEVIAKAAIEEIVKPFLAAHPDFVW